MARFYRIATVLVGLPLLALVSCDDLAAIRQEIRETRQMVRQLGEEAVTAVPGERYLRLIDDLNGPDPAKRQAAQSFLVNLAGIQPPSAPLRASAFFYFDSTTPLHTDLFAANSIDKVNVEYRLKDQQYRHMVVSSLLLPTPTRDQINRTVIKDIEDALDIVAGHPNALPTPAAGFYWGPDAIWDSDFMPTFNTRLGLTTINGAPASQYAGGPTFAQQVMSRHQAAKAQIASKLTDAIMAQYPPRDLPPFAGPVRS